MEVRRTARALLASFVLAALAAQAFIGFVESRTGPMEKASQGDDVKKPDCVPGVDPHTFPGIGGHGGGITPVPSHGGGITPVPSHGGSSGTSPSHGGSSDPSHGSSGSSPSTGGGYGGSPSHGGSGSSPSTGGAYGSSPSTPGGAYGSGAPSPSSGGGAYGGSSPTPSYGDSPSHGGIGTSSPTPFVPVDPHTLGSLPGSCDYWRSHPMEIWSAIGGRFPSSMGHFFGSAGSVGGANVSIQDALGNTRSDGAGALLREGAAALLNSMTRAGFPYTTEQVRDAFAAAAAGGSDGAAAAQAAAFKKANEGKA
ncbi:meiosis 5 precursor [Panicum miliaceum]|uniref:Meiosis 5 n=1 Tax=Panicum miliaceum TaxID=4540 RepID=A0A3L6SGJ0_PANMI|nr:meiosis 5 precursor [Panicum miliaceum]